LVAARKFREEAGRTHSNRRSAPNEPGKHAPYSQAEVIDEAARTNECDTSSAVKRSEEYFEALTQRNSGSPEGWSITQHWMLFKTLPGAAHPMDKGCAAPFNAKTAKAWETLKYA